MQAFESSTSVQSIANKAQCEVDDKKEKAASMVGELQKSTGAEFMF